MQDKIRLLGVSAATWHRILKNKQTPPPAILIGGRRYYRLKDISEWLRSLE